MWFFVVAAHFHGNIHNSLISDQQKAIHIWNLLCHGSPNKNRRSGWRPNEELISAVPSHDPPETLPTENPDKTDLFADRLDRLGGVRVDGIQNLDQQSKAGGVEMAEVLVQNDHRCSPSEVKSKAKSNGFI